MAEFFYVLFSRYQADYTRFALSLFSMTCVGLRVTGDGSDHPMGSPVVAPVLSVSCAMPTVPSACEPKGSGSISDLSLL